MSGGRLGGGGANITGQALTIKNSDGNWPAAVPAVIKQATDANNAGSDALYIVPGTSKRMFIGDASGNAFSLNLRYVSNLETVPSFATTDMMQWGYSSSASMVMGRSGNDVRTHSSGSGGSITWSVKTDGAFGGPGSTNVAVRLKADNNGIGFFGVTPVARPTVTGSRGGNAALASLLTSLASLGLIIDGSTA